MGETKRSGDIWKQPLYARNSNRLLEIFSAGSCSTRLFRQRNTCCWSVHCPGGTVRTFHLRLLVCFPSATLPPAATDLPRAAPPPSRRGDTPFPPESPGLYLPTPLGVALGSALGGERERFEGHRHSNSVRRQGEESAPRRDIKLKKTGKNIPRIFREWSTGLPSDLSRAWLVRLKRRGLHWAERVRGRDDAPCRGGRMDEFRTSYRRRLAQRGASLSRVFPAYYG